MASFGLKYLPNDIQIESLPAVERIQLYEFVITDDLGNQFTHSIRFECTFTKICDQYISKGETSCECRKDTNSNDTWQEQIHSFRTDRP